MFQTSSLMMLPLASEQDKVKVLTWQHPNDAIGRIPTGTKNGSAQILFKIVSVP